MEDTLLVSKSPMQNGFSARSPEGHSLPMGGAFQIPPRFYVKLWVQITSSAKSRTGQRFLSQICAWMIILLCTLHLCKLHLKLQLCMFQTLKKNFMKKAGHDRATPLEAPFQDSFSKEGNRLFFKPFVKATLSRLAYLLLQSKAGGIFFPKFWRALRWWTLVTALKSYQPPCGHQMIVIGLEDKEIISPPMNRSSGLEHGHRVLRSGWAHSLGAK